MDNMHYTSTGDDSDNDEVTDFLNSNNTITITATTTTITAAIISAPATLSATATAKTNTVNNAETSYPSINGIQNKSSTPNNAHILTENSVTSAATAASITPRLTIESQNYCIPVINTPSVVHSSNSNNNSNINNNNNNSNPHNSNNSNNRNNNMIPTINVTPHSPASSNKYNNIFEDTLNQLQNIRETVVQMKNSSVQMQDGLSKYGLLNAAILSASLPDLSAGNATGAVTALGGSQQYVLWSSIVPQPFLLNADRRKSWTAIDELSAANADATNKSISLSSLDSEEQETIRVTEQRRRSARNSTGGISTHSLNEAELARDFERIAAKRNLANEIISRIPLQKSISTSSIIAKEDIKAIARHLTDSEDENQSLLRAHAKIEVYDNVEKRRKRGSLFFRKKKDKAKMKTIGGQISACDVCGASISLTQIKEHQLECNVKSKKLIGQKSAPLIGAKRDRNEQQDYYDNTDGHHVNAYNDDTPLIRAEFLNEPPIEAHNLGADPTLGIALKEHDSWSPGVPKELLKSMNELQIKRQEHIYEFIMTEKHHCQTLLVVQKVFVESLERHFPNLNVHSMFPRLIELTELHTGFLKKLRLKQREQPAVDSIADILLEFFSLEQAQHLRLAYGEFCANHRSALELFKQCLTEQAFSEWYKHCLSNPLLKKKGIPECILFVTQRLTKYPLLIEPLLKSARDNKLEIDKLQHGLNLVKSLLVDVDACVAEKELRERQLDIYNRVDAKSFAIYKHKPFRKNDLGIESRRRLKFEGLATLMQGRAKTQLVLVVVLTDCLCFLCENSAHNKYTFFTPEHKAGVVPLQKLLIREKAGTESRGIYIISSNPDFPEMYELKVQTPKDKNVWIQSIRQAVLECPSTDVIEAEDLTAEEKLRIGVNKRETIEKMRQKDIEQALLLEEKLMLHLNLLKEQQIFNENDNNGTTVASAAQFLGSFGSYKDLVGIETDTSELWKRVLNTVQDISQLAATVYTAATGLPVSRSVSSVGEKQSEHYASPTLPKRAETFAGFDEKRAKHGTAPFPCRDAGKFATLQVLTPRLQELEEKRELRINNTPSALVTVPEATCASNTLESAALKEHNYAVLQVSHHLHTLLCIISQQMTTIQSLQLQLALYRENPRAVYTHNDQLEELRNLQDKLSEEKAAWLRQKEQQEQELSEMRTAQHKLQEQIKAEQEDIKQQREQLYRKMELLSNQGLLLSPSTPLPIASPTMLAAQQQQQHNSNDSHDGGSEDGHTINSSVNAMPTNTTTVDRRKDKWRTASTISKTPPVNLLSATNAPKINQTCVKQKIPMKLSSLSSSSNHAKIDKSASFNTSSTMSGVAVVQQLFPLKLADKRANIGAAVTVAPTATTAATTSTILTPQHSRTGSSPAIIQHATNVTSGSITHQLLQQQQLQKHSNIGNTATSSRNMQTPLKASNNNSGHNIVGLPTSITSNSMVTNKVNNRAPHVKPEEEEIYF